MRHNRSEYHTNQALRETKNMFYTNPYSKKVNRRVTRSAWPLLVCIIFCIMFAEPAINNVFSYFGV